MSPHQGKFIAYFRVSTEGKSGWGSRRSARRFSTISTAAGGSWCNPDQWRDWDDWVASELVSAASAGLANASPSQSVRMIKTIGAITVVVPRNFIASSLIGGSNARLPGSPLLSLSRYRFLVLVASHPARDLLLCAKHLFIAAMAESAPARRSRRQAGIRDERRDRTINVWRDRN